MIRPTTPHRGPGTAPGSRPGSRPGLLLSLRPVSRLGSRIGHGLSLLGAIALTALAGACGDKLPPPVGPGPVPGGTIPDDTLLVGYYDSTNTVFTVSRLLIPSGRRESLGVGVPITYVRGNGLGRLVTIAGLTFPDLSSTIIDLPTGREIVLPLGPSEEIDHGTEAISPDGTKVAVFVRRNPQKRVSLKLFDISGSTPRLISPSVQITPNGTNDVSYTWPAFSPDGQSIAWAQRTEFDSGLTNCGLMVLKLATSPATIEQIVDMTGAWIPSEYGQCEWSRDGQMIAAHVQPAYTSGQNLIIVDTSRRDIIWNTSALLGTSDADITFSWSPTGRTIAFNAAGTVGGTDIYLWDLDNAVMTPLTATTGINQLPHWSPDGKKLIYVSGVSAALPFLPPARLCLIDLASSRRTPDTIATMVTNAFWK